MKKIFVICLILLSVIVCTSCMTLMANALNYKSGFGDTPDEVPADVKEAYKKAAESLTPENSVVIVGRVGFIDEGAEAFYAQVDPKYPKDAQPIVDGYIVSKPVVPGSTYVLANIPWTYDNGYTLYEGMIPNTSRFLIKVPEKPGIYYLGWYSAWEIASYENGEIDYLEGDLEYYANEGEDKKLVKMLNKFLMSYYEGTCWEPEIQENAKKYK